VGAGEEDGRRRQAEEQHRLVGEVLVLQDSPGQGIQLERDRNHRSEVTSKNSTRGKH
jgi:predicted GTPase